MLPRPLPLRAMGLQNKPFPWLIFGLGNPGSQYEKTRHNSGFRMIELLMRRLDLRYKKPIFSPVQWGRHSPCNERGEALYLCQPLTYMNLSGKALSPFLRRFPQFPPSRLLVICDNMDLPPGEFRLKPQGSSAGQKGLQSIIDYLGDHRFPRLYMGVGRPAPGTSVPDHVLGVPEGEEADKLYHAEESLVEKLLQWPGLSWEEFLQDVRR